MDPAPAAGPPPAGRPGRRKGKAARQGWGAACVLPPASAGRRDRRAYRRHLRRLALDLVEVQREIRVLQGIHWPDRVSRRFLKRKGRELPRVEYAPLPFDPARKIADLKALEGLLDPGDPLQAILRDTARQYGRVVRMIAARGTPEFHRLSAGLYGHPREAFAGQTTTNLDLAHHLDRILGNASAAPPDGPLMTAEATAAHLEGRLRAAFRGAPVLVEVSHLLTADAAAGANRIRIKKGRMFGRETVDYLEQHEGYVHIATTLNGRRQPVLPILGKASPRGVRVNEGLAVFSEWASHTMTLRRIRRLVDRVLAIRMAEEGADFLEVYGAFLDRGESPPAAFDIARRVFRGGVLTGGAPFTKDASYLGDFLRIYNFARVAAKRRRMDLLELLFAGKVTLQDIPVLSRHLLTGEVRAPRYLPPWMGNRDWLIAHFAVSSFLDSIELGNTEKFYEDLFAQCAAPPGEPEAPRRRLPDDHAGHLHT
jgi:uncharacterized protein (TIGR02421 family)